MKRCACEVQFYRSPARRSLSSAPPAAPEQNDQLAAVVASSAARRPAAARRLPPHVPHPASGNAGVRLRASARRRAQPSAAPGPHCHPRREPVPANMPAYDYLRKNVRLSAALGPNVHRVRGGQVCGAGGTLWREEEARDGARACPTCLSLFLLSFSMYKHNVQVGTYTV